jgi:hypothetical protein
LNALKRSTHIEIGFVSIVAAAALSGCNAQSYHRDWQQCVNQDNVVVDDRYCDGSSYTPAAPLHPYHWWYSARPYYAGDVVIGGYPSPRPNMSVVRASSASVSRGGFGSSAHGSGGGA